jgi:hypothetical protein
VSLSRSPAGRAARPPRPRLARPSLARPSLARPSLARPSLAGLGLAAALLAAAGGCARMDAALGRQWVDVTFKPSTTLAGIEKVRAACAHVPNVHPYPLPRQHSVINLMAGVRFDTTNATDANVARLQECVQKFPAVQGFTPGDSADQGG